VATITVQIARALDAAHAKGLLHRDVKPGNVLVRQLPDGDHAYLTDFGLAKVQDRDAMTALTKTGYYIGTTGYLSPEQIRGEDATPLSDLYALGCVLSEALTGTRPFKRTNDMAVAWAHANDPRPKPSEQRPGLSAGWDEVVAKAMAIEPDQRYATGAAFAAAVNVAANEPTVTAPDPGPALDKRLESTPTAPAATEPIAPAPLSPAARHTRMQAPRTPTAQAGLGRGGRGPNATALIVLVMLAAAGVAVGAIAAFGGFSSGGPQTSSKAGAASSNAGSTPEQEADRGRVLGVLHAYETAYSSRSRAGLGALMSASVSRHGLRAGGCAEDTGRDAVLSAYAEQFSQGTGSYRLTGLTADAVHLSDGRAQIDTGYTISPGSSGSISFTLVKADGAWKIDRINASCG
jgi:hypothetical protein